MSKLGKKRSQNIQQYREDHQFGLEGILDMISEFDNSLSNVDEEHFFNVDRDLMRIIDAIAARIEFEEDVLFAMYDQITS